MAAVTAVWETVAEAETVEEVEFFSRKVPKVREAIQGYDSGRVLSAIRARRDAADVQRRARPSPSRTPNWRC